MSKGTSIYICADGTLTYGPYGGTEKIIPQAMPIAVVEDEDEAFDLITMMGRKAYNVPEADPRFEKQLKGRGIKPGYGPTFRYYYAFPEFVRNDETTLPAVRAKVEAVRDMLRSRTTLTKKA